MLKLTKLKYLINKTRNKYRYIIIDKLKKSKKQYK
jgi:hypothetical protein